MPVFARFARCVTVKKQEYLGGSPLKHGDVVIARWPDGTSSTHTIEVTPLGTFIVLKYRGMDLPYPLKNSELQLVRDE